MAEKITSIIRSKDVKTSYVHMNHKKTLKQADSMVEYLVSKFGSEQHTPFFRHVAWKLPDDTIRRLVAAALEKNGITSPLAYFIACVKHEAAYYN